MFADTSQRAEGEQPGRPNADDQFANIFDEVSDGHSLPMVLPPTYRQSVLIAFATRSGARCPVVVIRWSRVRRWSWLYYRERPWAHARSSGGQSARRYQRRQRPECGRRFCPPYWKPEGGGELYPLSFLPPTSAEILPQILRALAFKVLGSAL